MAMAGCDLGIASERNRRAHLAADCLGDILGTFFIFPENSFQERKPRALRPSRKYRKRSFGSSDSLVDIGLGAECDLREGLFRRGIDDIECDGDHRLHPFAIDEEFQVIAHAVLRACAL
ncbi:hypothetical protein D3C87_1594840 [compost metagenome]